MKTLLENDVEAEIFEATDGLETVEKKEKPDIVFLDLTMPKIDGFGALQQIGGLTR
jgi:two-component system, chemotaxis family, chemotaxis protein CheY